MIQVTPIIVEFFRVKPRSTFSQRVDFPLSRMFPRLSGKRTEILSGSISSSTESFFASFRPTSPAFSAGNQEVDSQDFKQAASAGQLQQQLLNIQRLQTARRSRPLLADVRLCRGRAQRLPSSPIMMLSPKYNLLVRQNDLDTRNDTKCFNCREGRSR